MTAPRVSVLMPVRNGRAFLREALDSLRRQTFRDFEVLVLDDGSTDGSQEIAAAFHDPRIRLIQQGEHCGLVATLNRGLGLVRGEFIARQDADDRSDPRRLDCQIRFLDRHPSVALVGTQAHVIDTEGRRVGVLARSLEPVSIRWYHLFDNAFIHSSVMLRRRALQEAGGAYEPLAHCEDYALWSAVALARPVANLPERLVDYRSHAGSVYGGLTEAQAEDAASANRVIIRRNLAALFGASTWADRDVELLARFRTGLDAARLEAFLALFRRLLREYGTRHPDAMRSRDFHRTVARQYDDLAYKLMPSTRRGTARVFGEALRHDPWVAGSLSWSRAAALLLLGKAGRARLRARWSPALAGLQDSWSPS